MDPTQTPPNQSNQPGGTPLFNAPFTQPVPPTAGNQPVPGDPMQAGPTDPVPNTKKPIFIAVGAGVALLLIITLLVVLTSSGKKTPSKTATTTATTATSQDPQPATSTGVQQTSDSISQDLSTITDDHDFPTNALDGTSLGL